MLECGPLIIPGLKTLITSLKPTTRRSSRRASERARTRARENDSKSDRPRKNALLRGLREREQERQTSQERIRRPLCTRPGRDEYSVGQALPRPAFSPSPPTDRSSESTRCVTTLSAKSKTGATAATTHAPHPRTPVHHAQYISMAKKHDACHSQSQY